MKKDVRALGLLSHEKRRFWADLIAYFQYIRELIRKMEKVFYKDRTGGNDVKLKEDRCRLDIRKNFFHSVGGEALEPDVQRR